MKKRFFEYNLGSFLLRRGKRNSIADVEGVRVGHATKIEGKNVRTGVTVIDPGVKNLYTDKLSAAVAVGNGYGKAVGFLQVKELGQLETPIVLTNTLAVGIVSRAVIDWVLDNTSIPKISTINVVVGETNDGLLNDIHLNTITKKDVYQAFSNLSEDFLTGNVGAGTGTRVFSWKGGIGTSSRIVELESKEYRVGIIIQTNYGGAYTCLGVPIGSILGKTDFKKATPSDDGSCMIILATDAPLSSNQLERMAKRTFFGLARTGSVMAHGSGDFAIAFSTSQKKDKDINFSVDDGDLNEFFLASVEATEESVYDAMFAAEDMEGRDGNKLESIDIQKVLQILSEHNVSPNSVKTKIG